jgi:hypothetical protein
MHPQGANEVRLIFATLRIHRGDTTGCWTTSPLRTAGCVKEPGPTMLRGVSAPPFGICLRNALPCTRVSPLESNRSANCLSFAVRSTRGITSAVRLHGIFVSDNQRSQASCAALHACKFTEVQDENRLTPYLVGSVPALISSSKMCLGRAPRSA